MPKDFRNLLIHEYFMIMSRMREYQDFAGMVYDNWIGHNLEENRKTAFDIFGSRIKRYKTGDEKTKFLDKKLSGENYEA